MEDLLSGNGWPLVLIAPNHRRGGGRVPELIRFKPYEFLEDNDLPFIKRFREIAFRDRPKVYRVPKNMEETAITHKAMDSLAML